MWTSFEFERRGRVAFLTLDRPDRHNALREGFWDELVDVLRAVDADADVRCLVLRGAGESFCAGGDVEDLAALSSFGAVHDHVRRSLDALDAIGRSAKPVIAAVGGLAVGAGMELVMAADFALASENATFGSPEVRLGLMPALSVYRGASAIGPGWTRYLAFTGKRVDARTALQIGLVQEVVPEGQLDAAVEDVTRRLCLASPASIVTAKAIINATAPSGGGAHARTGAALLHLAGDRDEGIAAFRERRRPDFAVEGGP